MQSGTFFLYVSIAWDFGRGTVPIYKECRYEASEVGGGPVVCCDCHIADSWGREKCCCALGRKIRRLEMRTVKRRMEKRNVPGIVCAGLLLVCGAFGMLVSVTAKEPTVVHAAAEMPEELSAEEKNVQVTDASGTATEETETPEEEKTAGQEIEVRPFTFRDWFGLVFCSALGIGVCLWAALYGDPKERERIRNKKIRKQLEQEALMKAAREEKKRKEAQEAARVETGEEAKPEEERKAAK